MESPDLIILSISIAMMIFCWVLAGLCAKHESNLLYGVPLLIISLGFVLSAISAFP